MPSSGPTPCSVLFVGEAFGKEEDVLKVPFIGESGRELRRMLSEAGFEPGIKHPFYPDQKVRLTNVFMQRPAPGSNELSALCAKRAEVGKDYLLPPLAQGKWVRPEHLHHLTSLKEEILRSQPRLIVALGNTACWALLGRTGITSLRGNVFPNWLVPGAAPVFATYHPSNILYDWSNRVIAVGDFMKAKRWLDEGFSPRKRQLLLEPTLDEAREFVASYLLCDPPPPLISMDIETLGETITCIGFAASLDRAITIPFFDPARRDRNYWATLEEELAAWELVFQVCTSDVPKLGQNGLYDIQYLYRARIAVRKYLQDTMIRSHSLWPELPKGLGFLGSVHTDEAPWKLLRNRKRDDFKLEDD